MAGPNPDTITKFELEILALVLAEFPTGVTVSELTETFGLGPLRLRFLLRVLQQQGVATIAGHQITSVGGSPEPVWKVV